MKLRLLLRRDRAVQFTLLCSVVFIILVIGEPHDDDRTDAVVHTVVTDTAEPGLGGPLRSPESPAAHHDGAEAEPLDLQAQPLLHVVVLDYVDLVRRLGFLKRPGEVVGFGDGEIVEIVLELLLGLLVFGDGDVGGAPVGAVEDASGPDVEEDDGIARAEVVLDGPFDGEGALVAEIDGDPDSALGSGGGGPARRVARGRRLDYDCSGGLAISRF